MTEADFTFAAEHLTASLAEASRLAQQPDPVDAEVERLASAARVLLDRIAERDRRRAEEAARELWDMLHDVGYKPRIIKPPAQ